jgi:hypothetical protein
MPTLTSALNLGRPQGKVWKDPGDGQGARSMHCLPLPRDRLHLVVVVHLLTIYVSDNVRIHGIALMVGAGLWVSTPHGANMGQAPRPISHAPGSFGTEIGSATISLKVLILNSVKEGGVGLSGKDQLLTRGVAGQPKSKKLLPVLPVDTP